MISHPTLQQIYEQTTYATDEPPLSIRIRCLHPVLDDVLAWCQSRSWAFITAWNPGSRPLTISENQQRNTDLSKELKPWKVLHGRGIPDYGDWTPEESFLVLGISEEEAQSLGKRWGQAAVLFGEFNQPARLIWCS